MKTSTRYKALCVDDSRNKGEDGCCSVEEEEQERTILRA
ncbi:WSSV364 [White spot syndrome virus]|uniref:WSSV364 n=1 Tax=White spot syndrome virus TaxID=342409 RepID=A0A2I6SC71_9VIRU|nr:WSSV364 [White spot syndrome virus]